MEVDGGQMETMSSGKVSTVITGQMGKRPFPAESNNSTEPLYANIPKKPKLEPEKKKVGFSKYKSLDLMTRIVTRLENSDRQMATRLLREFESEHLPALQDDSWDVKQKLLQVAVISKYDQLSAMSLRMALCAMRRADLDEWMRLVDLLIASEVQENALSSRSALDSRLLPFYVEAMQRGAIDVNQIPLKVHQAANRSLCSNNTQRRIAALQFQVTVELKKCHNSEDFSLVETMLCRFSEDRDARVRRAAVDGLFLLCQKEASLNLSSYSTAVLLMKDANRSIRLICIQILLSFANRMPDQLVNSAYGLANETQLRLCDDAFSVICNAINDMDVSVRTEAAVTLGKFENVSDSFLDQTLDKKLMATLKNTDLDAAPRRQQHSMFAITKQGQGLDSQQRQRRWKARDRDYGKKQHEAASEWSRGKELNAPAPSAAAVAAAPVDEDAIIPQGACGAFVSALEDEFMSVRRAAVYSLGKLAAFRPSFAVMALDHLADMFNDEISEVRLDAIYALTPLIVHGQLQKEQLEVILKCLDDAQSQSRQAMRDLLSKADFADSDCLKLCTKSLLNCLKRFPSDKDDIYSCFSCIGRNHGVQVHALTTELLELESVFEPQERPIDDVFYISKLILILNGASVYEPITALLPKYVIRHYFFLRSSSPDLVESIKAIDENGKNELVNVLAPKLKSAEEAEKQAEENARLMERTYERLRETELETHSANRDCLRRLISEDVNAIASFNSLLSGSCRFIASLCSICASFDTLSQILMCGSPDELAHIGYLVEEELRNLLNVEHQFSHIPEEMVSFLVECKFFIRLLAACAKLGCNPSAYAEILDEIADEYEIAKIGWSACSCPTSTHGVSLIQSIEQHLSVDSSIQGEDSKKIITFAALSSYLNKYVPLIPKTASEIPKIEAKWAEVIEPNKDLALETTVKFVAGLPRSIAILAHLHNLSEADISRLHIMIEYPDQTVSYYRPRNSDFERKQLDPKVIILNTKAMLSSARPWLSSAAIRLLFVLLIAEPLKSVLTPVPLFDSPTKARFATIRLRVHPLTKI